MCGHRWTGRGEPCKKKRKRYSSLAETLPCWRLKTEGGQPTRFSLCAYVGPGLKRGKRSEAIPYDCQQINPRLQVGNAKMILSCRRWWALAQLRSVWVWAGCGRYVGFWRGRLLRPSLGFVFLLIFILVCYRLVFVLRLVVVLS